MYHHYTILFTPKFTWKDEDHDIPPREPPYHWSLVLSQYRHPPDVLRQLEPAMVSGILIWNGTVRFATSFSSSPPSGQGLILQAKLLSKCL